MHESIYLIKAPTLEDLRDKTDYATRQYGPDCRWIAHEDGEIHINDNRGITVLIIKP